MKVAIASLLFLVSMTARADEDRLVYVGSPFVNKNCGYASAQVIYDIVKGPGYSSPIDLSQMGKILVSEISPGAQYSVQITDASDITKILINTQVETSLLVNEACEAKNYKILPDDLSWNSVPQNLVRPVPPGTF